MFLSYLLLYVYNVKLSSDRFLVFHCKTNFSMPVIFW